MRPADILGGLGLYALLALCILGASALFLALEAAWRGAP